MRIHSKKNFYACSAQKSYLRRWLDPPRLTRSFVSELLEFNRNRSREALLSFTEKHFYVQTLSGQSAWPWQWRANKQNIDGAVMTPVDKKRVNWCILKLLGVFPQYRLNKTMQHTHCGVSSYHVTHSRHTHIWGRRHAPTIENAPMYHLVLFPLTKHGVAGYSTFNFLRRWLYRSPPLLLQMDPANNTIDNQAQALAAPCWASATFVQPHRWGF